jgi:hypothetical protein
MIHIEAFVIKTSSNSFKNRAYIIQSALFLIFTEK